ncbi:MAG: zinc ABC transporter substrate-binding protein [Ruminococcus sp.]|nr:zinc ABC transporter substrate-binding protein [Ruminococcus sp.]
MKFRFLTCLLCGAMLFSALACGCTVDGSGDERIKVVTTVFPTYDFVREIGGDQADVTLLLTPGAESHSYEPTAADVLKIQQCDVFVYIGGVSEQWVGEVLENLNTEKTEVIRLFDCVTPIEQSHDHEHENASDEHDHHEAEYDEHIWASPLNAIRMTQEISAAMERIDPENMGLYSSNTDTYVHKLTQLDLLYRKAVQDAQYDTLIFGDRFPFRYLVEEYGLQYHAAFTGCSSETEASASTLAFLIETIQTENVPLVLYTESSTKKIADRICEATGADSAMLHSCNNVTKQELADGVTYLSLMEQNLDVLKRALSVAGEETT